ncbi:MAG: OmpA family protein [Opitutaceae bacterium]|nr:OmpA family protein [Opitutaceae bacterium]
MKLASKILCLAVASAALVLAGCTKKPTRPDPSQTALGLTPGGGSINSSVTDGNLGGVPPELSSRGEGFDANNQNRSALEAQTVYFDFDSSAIKASEREKLKAAKDYLDKNPGYKLLLEGHCDWRGTAEYNLSLGDRRANATKRYLQSIGVSPDKMDTLSKGSLEAARNADAGTMQKDRRVALVVVNPAGAPVPAAAAAPLPAPAPL